MAGEPYVGHPLAQTVPEPIAQPRQPLGLRAHVARANLDRLAEPDDPGHVLGARAPAALVLAAVLDRDHLGPLADVAPGGAPGAVAPVGRKRRHVSPDRV